MNEEAIFHEALSRTAPEERAAYLEQACAGDPVLRASVEALLRASVGATGFLDCPASAPAATMDELAPGRGAKEWQRAADLEPGQSAENDNPEENLHFLTPCDRPAVLGCLGHYDVLEVLGQGGMGVVLRAFDAKLHRVVAIKVMAAQLATNASARKRFTREAQAQAAVSHDHVVTIHAVEEANGLPYLVMQYVAGLSLQQRLDRDGALDLHEVLRIGMQTAAGLAAAHAQGLVHRDIKPANILLENGIERVKITDFGLARAATEASLTQSGVVAGTPQYMSPEQAEGKAIDQRTDLFSLGSTLYAMCTGRAPFRASGSMAVLKRVCEATPTPIRATNPQMPDWLVAIIARLQARDPAGRFQSAAEVAELLGRHLAHVQHPSVVGPVSNLPQETKAVRKPDSRRRPLAGAAAVLLCLVAGLSLTEATGVTSLRATVIRVLTPDGTLVVEVDDPGVKVTIEGDGGLVITGAGPHEVRLRPGSYNLHADRDGKRVPLERELVRIARGGRERVRVRLEPAAAPPKDATQARVDPTQSERQAFVLLGGQGVAERKFDTLADAVQAACDGDTIEIRGNGPFVSDGVTIGNPLVIRAGEGYTPSITLSQDAADKNIALLTTSASLVLEGLELRRMGGADGKVENRLARLLDLWNCGALHIANCRLIFKADQPHLSKGALFGSKAKSFSVLNSVLSCNAASGDVGWRFPPGGHCYIENCVSAIGGIGLGLDDGGFTDVSIHVRGNSFVGRCMSLTLWSKPNLPEKGEALPPIRLDFSRNVTFSEASFRNRGILYFHQYQLQPPFSAAAAEALVPRLVRLDEHQNVYLDGTRMLRLAADWKIIEGTRGHDLADWNQCWDQQNTGSMEGNVRFQGGDLLTRARSAPERLTAGDFRLRPDSAGYRAGKDGKDLGADVDLVGPGPAYERWKKTPEYQQWLRDTGQVKK